MSFFPERWGGREIPLHKIPTNIPKNKFKKNNNMQLINITTKSVFEQKSSLEINEFLDNIKESFNKVVIVSIESLPMEYSKFYDYNYRVSFYHDLSLKI